MAAPPKFEKWLKDKPEAGLGRGWDEADEKPQGTELEESVASTATLEQMTDYLRVKNDAGQAGAWMNMTDLVGERVTLYDIEGPRWRQGRDSPEWFVTAKRQDGTPLKTSLSAGVDGRNFEMVGLRANIRRHGPLSVEVARTGRRVRLIDPLPVWPGTG
jgi:hypothetical protein